jgi:hypothetical protein
MRSRFRDHVPTLIWLLATGFAIGVLIALG